MAQNKKFNDAAVGFRPQTAFPLNANEYFESLDAAKAAAATAEEVGTAASFRTTYYIGQVLAVYDKQKDPASVAVYQIAPDKTLQSITTGDFGKYVKNEDLSGYVEPVGEKKYKISIDSNGKAYVNVPWTGGSAGDVAVDDITIGKNVQDNNKLFLKSIPDRLLSAYVSSAVSVQISSKLGAYVKGTDLSGYQQAAIDDKKYKISIDSNGKAYVYVPWTGGSASDIAVDDVTIGKKSLDGNKIYVKQVPTNLISNYVSSQVSSYVSTQISSLSSQISGNFLSGEYPADASKYLDGTGQWSQPPAAVLLKKW